MKIVSDVYSELGKALLGIGQGVVIATAIAKLLTHEPISWWAVLIGFFMSSIPAAVGLYFIQRGQNLKRLEGA